MRGLDRYGPV
jgi:putative ABC transport system substrate-binding protein